MLASCPDPGCPMPNWIGDSYCDDETNIPECMYDGGDCCDHAEEDGSFSLTCTACLCLLRTAFHLEQFGLL